MAYLKNLDELDLDQYNHDELVKLASRIIGKVGPEAAWTAIDDATTVLSEHSTEVPAVVFGCRYDPDDPNALVSLASYPLATSLDDLDKRVMPLLARHACLQASMQKPIGVPVGIGPAGFSEMLAKHVISQFKQDGHDPGDGPRFIKIDH